VAETLLTLRDVVVEYGDLTALQISSLSIRAKEVLALIGPNGAGKSTLLRVIGLLQRPNAGKVYFRDEEATRKNALRLRRRMASVFQEPLLLNASVYDNAALGLRLRGLSGGEIEKRLLPWLKRLEIGHLGMQAARTLSRGEAQRTSLARALVLEPELLLLDEPFSGLDAPTREGMLDSLRDIIEQKEMTTILVTHDKFEAYNLASRIGVISHGRMLQLADNGAVLMHPRTEEVAEIVGLQNRIPGVVESGNAGICDVRVHGGKVRVLGRLEPETPVILCVPPEDIALDAPGETSCQPVDANRLVVVIGNISPGLVHYRVTLRCGDVSLFASVPRVKFSELGLREGKKITVLFEPSAVHVIELRRDS